jgi:hypothetical protein
VLLRELRERVPDRLHVAQIDRVRVLHLEHGRGVEHVLRRGPEVDVFAEIGLCTGPDAFSAGISGCLMRRISARDLLDVDLSTSQCSRSLSRPPRDDAELRLLERERGLEVVPLLHAGCVAENRAQLVGAPQMLDQCVVEYAGCHGISPRKGASIVLPLLCPLPRRGLAFARKEKNTQRPPLISPRGGA